MWYANVENADQPQIFMSGTKMGEKKTNNKNSQISCIYCNLTLGRAELWFMGIFILAYLVTEIY